MSTTLELRTRHVGWRRRLLVELVDEFGEVVEQGHDGDEVTLVVNVDLS